MFSSCTKSETCCGNKICVWEEKRFPGKQTVKNIPEKLLALLRENCCSAVVFGHAEV